MKNELKLAVGLTLPVEIGTETVAILGRRGSGKSNTATVLIEELIAAGQQAVLIDPKGEGWGLKAQGRGGPGLDVVVFGEPEADLPLREEHGETIADFVVNSGRSCVLSVKGIPSDAGQRRFVARFTERLFNLKGKAENRTPLMVVIDEAHLFVPQRVDAGQIDVVSRVQRMVRLGRSSGIGVTLVDQRPASVNKDVLTQLELMVCHQLTGPQDRKAVDEWVDANADREQAADFRRSLPTLGKGEAWFWSPALLKLFKRVQVRPRHTFDSSGTPVLGRDAAKRPKMRPVNLDELRGQLDAVVAEAKANDPAELRKQLAAAKADLAKAAAKPVPAEVRTVDRPVVTDAQVKQVEGIVERMEREGRERIGAADQMKLSADQLRQSGEQLVKTGAEFAAALRTGVPRPVVPDWYANRERPKFSNPAIQSIRSPNGTKVDRPTRATPSAVARPGESLPKGERAILIVCAQHADGAARDQLTVMTGYKRSSRDTYLQRLRERGHIEMSGDQVMATASGVAALGSDFEPLPTGEALQDYWRQRLPEGERRILDVLLRADGAPVDRETIDAATGYKRSSRDTYIQRLSSRRLVETSREGVTASAVLFDVVPA